MSPLDRARDSCHPPRARGQHSPGDQHGGVVVGYAVLGDGVPVAVPVDDGFLPLAEAVQGFPGVVVDLQRGLEWKQWERVIPGKLWWEGTAHSVPAER